MKSQWSVQAVLAAGLALTGVAQEPSREMAHAHLPPCVAGPAGHPLPERPAAVGDWPGWRGPTLNGIAAGGDSLPISWSETENVVWKTEVPGRGHSSPTVVGDRLFLSTADDALQVQSVLGFDRRTGKSLWKTDVHRGGFPGKIHPKNTHASSTVASDGERLFAVFFNHQAIRVTALGLDGRILWQQAASPFQPKRYEHGYGASPVLYNSLLVIAADFDGCANLVALEGKTGRVRWRASRPPYCSYSSPVVARVAGRDQILLGGSDLVASYDPDTGKRLWSCPPLTESTAGTAVWEGNRVFTSGGYPKGGTYGILADGSGRVLWQNGRKCTHQSMLAHEGHVYAVDDNGIGFCWKAADGSEMWKARLGGPVSSSLVLAGGNVYVSSERGTTVVFRADPGGFRELGRSQLGEESFATPAFCGGRIYARVARRVDGARQEVLYCIGHP